MYHHNHQPGTNLLQCNSQTNAVQCRPTTELCLAGAMSCKQLGATRGLCRADATLARTSDQSHSNLAMGIPYYLDLVNGQCKHGSNTFFAYNLSATGCRESPFSCKRSAHAPRSRELWYGIRTLLFQPLFRVQNIPLFRVQNSDLVRDSG